MQTAGGIKRAAVGPQGASTPPPPPAPSQATVTPFRPFSPSKVLEGHTRTVTCVKFSPDGQWLASASADRTIRIWEVKKEVLAVTLEGHVLGINDLAWSPDSRWLASASDDKTVVIWSRQTGEMMKTLKGHSNYVMALAWNTQGNKIASGSFDESVRVWDVKRGICLRILPAHSDPCVAVDFSRDGTVIITGGYDGLVRLWDTNTGQCLCTYTGEGESVPVSSVMSAPNQELVFVGTLDSTLRLLSVDTASQKFKKVKEYKGHVNQKFSLLPGLGRVCLISGGEDSKIYVWDLQKRNILQTLEGHTGVVFCVDIAPSFEVFASGGEDGTVKLWNRT